MSGKGLKYHISGVKIKEFPFKEKTKQKKYLIYSLIFSFNFIKF